jgi:hypothetical protein
MEIWVGNREGVVGAVSWEKRLPKIRQEAEFL